MPARRPWIWTPRWTGSAAPSSSPHSRRGVAGPGWRQLVPTAATLLGVDVRILVVDGVPTEYRVAGEGEPLVLVHGLSGSWRWWRPVLEPLAEHRCVYLLDLPRLRRRFPAAGLTGWLGRWLDAAALESVDLVGHSLGGLIAAELAAEQPQRAHRLVLVAPAGLACGSTALGRSVPLLRTLYDVRRRLPTIVGDAVRAGPVSLLRGALFASGQDLSVKLASIHTRTLLVWGEDDRLLPGADRRGVGANPARLSVRPPPMRARADVGRATGAGVLLARLPRRGAR